MMNGKKDKQDCMIKNLKELNFKYETLVKYIALKLSMPEEEVYKTIDETYDKLKDQELESYCKKLYGEEKIEH